jgi:hypothetical protein
MFKLSRDRRRKREVHGTEIMVSTQQRESKVRKKTEKKRETISTACHK